MVLAEPNAVSGVLPFIKTLYPDQSNATIQLFITTGALGAIFGSLLLSVLGNKVRKRTIVMVSLVVFTLGGMLPVLIIGHTAYIWVLVSRLFMGASLGILGPLLAALIALFYRKGRARDDMMGLQTTLTCIFGFAMPLIAGALILIQWRLSFLVYLLGLVCLGLFWKYVPEPVQIGEEQRKAAQGELKGYTFANLKLPSGVWFGALFMAVTQLCTGVFLFGTSLVIVDEKQIGSATMASWITALYYVVGALVGIVFGGIYSRLKNYTGSIVLIIWAISAFAAYKTMSLVAFFAAAIFGGVVQVYVSFILTAVNREVPSKQASTASSVVYLLMQTAGFVSPYALTWIAITLTGKDSVNNEFLGASVVIAVLAVVSGLYYMVHRIPDAEDPSEEVKDEGLTDLMTQPASGSPVETN
ncbi:MAG: MFS transporter [Bifidobacterium sp.]|uniref:MFS transporter n=1 Tax=Bifidobacterium sp. TaxID=41200 RepID=UPI0039E87DF8